MIKKLFFMILGSLLILSACSNNDEKIKTLMTKKSESHMSIMMKVKFLKI